MRKENSNKFVQFSTNVSAICGRLVGSLRVYGGNTVQVIRNSTPDQLVPAYKSSAFTPLYAPFTPAFSHNKFALFISVNSPLLPTIHSAYKNNKKITI